VALLRAPAVEFLELLDFIERYAMMGRCIGFVGVFLLAAALPAGCSLRTKDVQLEKAAKDHGIAYRQ
jgi:hypothetical protein